MTVVGVTGHANLTEPSIDIVRRELVDVLSPYRDGLVGMTCLARGADQAFADAVLELGGVLTIVSPASDYFSGITDEAGRRRCAAFLDVAATTVTMDFATSGQAAYLAASRYLVDHSDLLLAVWDGRPGSGSADAVAYAHERGRRVTIVWPDGVHRSA